MRLRALIVAAAAVASLAACTANNKAPTPTPPNTSTPTFGELPAWSDKAPSNYSHISTFPKPANATTIRFYSNYNTIVGNTTQYQLDDVGDGIQVRYTCTGNELINGDHLAIVVGTLDGKGNKSHYDRVDGFKQSDSFFFSWGWLATNVIGEGQHFVEMQGAPCQWEFNLLKFTPPSPTPTS